MLIVVFHTIIKKDGFVGGDLCTSELFRECFFEGISVGDVRVHLEDVPNHVHFFMAKHINLNEDLVLFEPVKEWCVVLLSELDVLYSFGCAENASDHIVIFKHRMS